MTGVVGFAGATAVGGDRVTGASVAGGTWVTGPTAAVAQFPVAVGATAVGRLGSCVLPPLLLLGSLGL